MAKTSRKSLVKKLDDVFSRYIRKRDKYQCFTCGLVGREGDGVMQCGHLFSRVSYSTRWHEFNAFCQCRGCNMRHEYDFEPFRRNYVARLGSDVYDSVYRAWCKSEKMSNINLLGLYEHYKAKLDGLS